MALTPIYLPNSHGSAGQFSAADEMLIKQVVAGLVLMPQMLPSMQQATDKISQEAVRRYLAQQASGQVPSSSVSTGYPWANTAVPDEDTLNRLLSRTKGQVFLHSKCAGFLGSMMTDHAYVWDETAPTAWCNGETVAFNPQFFMWMTPPARLTVLVHELMHTGFDHMSRFGTERCPDLWNQAADHVINNLLQDWGFEFDYLMQIEPCLDTQYKGMTTEEVYDLLPKPPSGMPMPQPQTGSGLPGGQGTAMPGSSPTPGPQGSQGPLQSPLSGDVRPSPNTAAAADVKAKQVKAIQAAQMSKSAGELPGEIVLQVEKFLNPILPWDQLLSRFYTELSQDDYSWKRPSRRYEDEYLPSLDGDSKLDHLTYYIDISGSVTDEEVFRFLSEVKHIHDAHQPKKITIVTFDDGIRDEIVILDDDPFEKITVIGRGGTELDPVYHHIKKHKPTAAIVFSDLICHPMGRDPGVPLVWIVVNNKAARVNFGKKVNIKV